MDTQLAMSIVVMGCFVFFEKCAYTSSIIPHTGSVSNQSNELLLSRLFGDDAKYGGDGGGGDGGGDDGGGGDEAHLNSTLANVLRSSRYRYPPVSQYMYVVSGQFVLLVAYPTSTPISPLQPFSQPSAYISHRVADALYSRNIFAVDISEYVYQRLLLS